MSYASQSDLAQDNDFKDRLAAALVKEAKPKSDDLLADQVLRNPDAGATMFIPLVAAEPEFDSTYEAGGQGGVSDYQILVAVQGNWTQVRELWFPAPVEP